MAHIVDLSRRRGSSTDESDTGSPSIGSVASFDSREDDNVSNSSKTSSSRHSSGSKHSKHKHRQHKHHHSKKRNPLPEIRHVIDDCPIFASLSTENRTKLAKDFFCVAVSIRIAHWLVEWQLTRQDVEVIATALAQVPVMASCCLLYEPRLQRAFLINTKMQRQRISYEQDEGFASSRCRWFVLWSVESEKPTLIQPESVPFFAKAIDSVAEEMNKLCHSTLLGTKLPIIGIPYFDTIPLTKVAKQLVTVQQFLLGHPVITVVADCEASTALEMFEHMGRAKAWQTNVFLEGIDPDDDHLLIKALWPADLFRYDDLDTFESEVPDLRGMTNRYQAYILQNLDDLPLVKGIWQDTAITIEGPFTYQTGWQQCSIQSRIKSDFTNINKQVIEQAFQQRLANLSVDE